MTGSVWDRLRDAFGERLLRAEPLSTYTTYRIGGPAAGMLHPRTTEEVAEAIGICHESGTEWKALGLGSNVLIADSGYRGLVIRMGKGVDGIVGTPESDRVWRVAAGMPTPRLAQLTAAAGVSGAHRLAGIPGTVGGGVATNAGAHGQEYCQIVRSLECVENDGRVVEVTREAVDWEYRKGARGVAVTSVTLEFTEGDAAAQQEEIQALNSARKRKTPFGARCCGSVFKNPAPFREGQSNISAGQLIDAAGLKGFRIGSAEVSKLHANYIVNLGGASSAEVLAVIETVRGRVFGAFGVELELEVEIIN